MPVDAECPFSTDAIANLHRLAVSMSSQYGELTCEHEVLMMLMFEHDALTHMMADGRINATEFSRECAKRQEIAVLNSQYQGGGK